MTCTSAPSFIATTSSTGSSTSFGRALFGFDPLGLGSTLTSNLCGIVSWTHHSLTHTTEIWRAPASSAVLPDSNMLYQFINLTYIIYKFRLISLPFEGTTFHSVLLFIFALWFTLNFHSLDPLAGILPDSGINISSCVPVSVMTSTVRSEEQGARNEKMQENSLEKYLFIQHGEDRSHTWST